MIVNQAQAQDLFQVSSQSVSSSSAVSSVAPVNSNITLNNTPNLFSSFASIQTEVFVIAINHFLIGWTILYSLFFILQFWWKRIEKAGELANEEDGVKAINECLYIWLRYLLFLVVATIFGFAINTFFELVILPLVILAFVYKLRADLLGAVAFVGYFAWAKNAVSYLKKILRA